MRRIIIGYPLPTKNRASIEICLLRTLDLLHLAKSLTRKSTRISLLILNKFIYKRTRNFITRSIKPTNKILLKRSINFDTYSGLDLYTC